jgi:hypothetical protein
MIDFFTHPGLQPFLISGLVLFGLLALEIALLMTGMTGMIELDGPEIDGLDLIGDFEGMDASSIAAEMDIDPGIAAQIEAEISGADASASSGGITEPGLEASSGTTSVIGTVLDFMGLRRTSLPLTVALSLFAACFSGIGISAQMIVHALSGMMFPSWIMVPVVFFPASILTRKLSRFIAYIIPKDETSSISRRSLGRRRGIVTVGTARKGQPAEVKIIDHYGNPHYTMLEPLSAEDEIPEQSEVLVIRRRNGDLRIVRIG